MRLAPVLTVLVWCQPNQQETLQPILTTSKVPQRLQTEENKLSEPLQSNDVPQQVEIPKEFVLSDNIIFFIHAVDNKLLALYLYLEGCISIVSEFGNIGSIY